MRGGWIEEEREAGKLNNPEWRKVWIGGGMVRGCSVEKRTLRRRVGGGREETGGGAGGGGGGGGGGGEEAVESGEGDSSRDMVCCRHALGARERGGRVQLLDAEGGMSHPKTGKTEEERGSASVVRKTGAGDCAGAPSGFEVGGKGVTPGGG